MNGRPVLLVIYDRGSLAPTRLAQAARGNECDLVFLVARSEHARAMIPTLEMVGSIVRMDGRTDAEILDTLRDTKWAGILTFSEMQIETTVRYAEALGLPYHAAEDLGAITHKDLQRERLAQAGIETPRFRTITSLAEVDEAIAHVGVPAIIKPIVGVSSRNTVAVTTPEQCRGVLAGILGAGRADGVPVETAVLIETLLVGRPTEPPWGDYIAVDCAASGGTVHPIFVTSKFSLAEPFRERGGYGGFSVVPESEVGEVLDLACRAVTALNVRNGFADVEIKLTEQGPRLIEVNGRLGGWVDDLAVRSGTADPADTAVRCALGRDFDRPGIKKDGPIAFDYQIVPPVGARRVRSIRNVARLRKLKNVDRVSVLAEPGASVDWRIGANGNVASVAGTVDCHEALADTVTQIENAEWIEYD